MSKDQQGNGEARLAVGAQRNHGSTGIGIGDLNRAVAWTSLTLGAGTGLILGLWSFDGPLPVPAWIGDYGDTPRRLLRLAHIAFFGLGILNLLLARELLALGLGERTMRAAFRCMNFGNALLPMTLFAAAIHLPLMPLAALPAVSVFVSLGLTAGGVWRRLRNP